MGLNETGRLLAVMYCERAETKPPEQQQLYYLLALHHDPGNTNALLFLSQLARDNENEWEALGYALEAVRTHPENPNSHFAAGRMYEELGNPEAAVRSYEAVLRLDPEYAPAHLHMAILLLAEGNSANFGKACWHLQRFVDNPDGFEDHLPAVLEKIVELNIARGYSVLAK